MRRVPPLLTLPEARMQHELERAAAIAAGAAVYRRQTVRLVLVCIGDYVVGVAIMGLSHHITDVNLAQLLFNVGLDCSIRRTQSAALSSCRRYETSITDSKRSH